MLLSCAVFTDVIHQHSRLIAGNTNITTFNETTAATSFTASRADLVRQNTLRGVSLRVPRMISAVK